MEEQSQLNLNKRFGIHLLSNAIWAQTGYGGQAKLIIPRMQARGHEMSMTAYYGLAGHTLRINDINVFPVGYHPYGMDVAAGNTKLAGASILITNVDMWVCEPENFRQTLWVPWFPIDSGTINPMIRAKLPHAWERICMSKHGKELVEKLGHECGYIPCAVDMNVYQPVDRADALKEVNAHIPAKIPADPFVVSIVAMNKGNPSRKAFYAQMKAFSEFHKKHPDTVLYMHTIKSEYGEQGGVNLVEICRMLDLKIGEVVFFPDALTIINGYPDVFLNAVYNVSDVLSSVTMGEGFGIPIVEAQAAGCPVITGDWTSMSEVTKTGWMVDKADAIEVFTQLGALQYEPRWQAIADKYEQAYKSGKKELIDKAREGVKEYDIENVFPTYWIPFLDKIEERLKDRPEFTEPQR